LIKPILTVCAEAIDAPPVAANMTNTETAIRDGFCGLMDAFLPSLLAKSRRHSSEKTQ
jgi:hypothetical protein